MATRVALLRGINVGTKNRLPMADLRSVMEELGYTDVATYIQSGNIVFDDPGESADTAPTIEQGIADRFGYSVTVVTRTPAEFRAAADACPYDAEAIEGKFLHIAYLSDAPDTAAIADLDPDRSPGDEYTVLGRELYVHFPNGSADSKFTITYFEKTLGIAATMRNWNTVRELLAMLDERA